MKITKEMDIMSAVDSYPETIDVFQRFGMHCFGCMAARFENIEDGATAHGIDVDTLLTALNEVAQ
jgi:hybrid cluster-associated redox disulfide protein